MRSHGSKFPSLTKLRATTALLLVLTLLIGVNGVFTPKSRVAAQEIEPTATATPTATPPVPVAPPDGVADVAGSNGLFYEVDGDPPSSFGVDTLDSRLVGIDLGQLSEAVESPVGPKDPVTGEPQPPHKLVLNLFDDVAFTGIVEHVEPTASGHALWGSLEGVELGTMTMVVNGSVVVGTVRTPYAVYSIRTAGDGTYVIRQIDESSLPPLGEPLETPLSPRNTPQQSTDISPDDGSVIDVMVVYTPLAKHREGGRAAIEALIDHFVTETNLAYANSGVIHRIRLVLREEVEYIEEGDATVDLRRLRRDSDEYMNHIHELRDMYAADLVHLVLGRGDVCGEAYLNRGESSAEREEFGFALTLVYCGGLTFAHELGHNMGLHHDRYEVGLSSSVGRVPLTGAHYGYVNQKAFEPDAPESTRWRTIMSYNLQCREVGSFGCERLPYFSNPELTYNGDPMGVTADHPSTGVDGPADAVGSLNERREITANFRRSSASPTPRVGLTLSQYWLAENGGESTVTATLHRVSSADTTVTVSASPSDAVRLSGRGTLIIPAGKTVSRRGAVTITGVNNGTRTGDVSVTISATVANSSNSGVVAPEPVELAIADDETTPVVTLSLSLTEIVELDGRTIVTASLDNRSGAVTTVTVSATPTDIVREIYADTLTIPAGQLTSSGYGVSIYPLNDEELTVPEKTVTVSGTATNSQGVTGPESVKLTVFDDEAPFFVADSIGFTFTEGVAASRVLPEAAHGNGTLTYSLSPAPSNGVTFAPGPPARIEVSPAAEAGDETSYTLTATDEDGDTGSMTIHFTIRKGLCLNSTSVSRYSDPGIVADCEALLSSRDTLGGNIALNWHENLSIDEWQGVEIANGRVVEVDLRHLGLTGTIPGELGSLVSLKRLDLSINQLTGEIPAELGNLSALESMDLSINQLTGEIPAELGNLSALEVMDLQFNELTGEIPKELGNLANLEELWLGFNQLDEGIPVELGNLSNLRELELSDNQLTGKIPNELGNLGNLESLGIHSNQLTGEIPAELGNLSNLRSLLLSGNELTGGIPTELSNLSNLRVLWIKGNQLTGTIPTELGNLSNLEQLILEVNLLTGEIPAELGNLSKLEVLWLGYNRLTGSIPTELENLPNLRSLYLSGSQLTGCVPDGLREVPDNDFVFLNMPFCSELACANRGAVADATNEGLVSDCGALLTARDVLAGNAALNWSADIPIEDWSGVVVSGTPGRVTELHLADMGLNGKIPREIEGLANLQTLDLGGNELTGQIPTELGSLIDLEYLNLSGNQLTGGIPVELVSLVNLQTMYLGGNRLTLCVPNGLRDVPNNDLASLGLPFCSEHPCVSGGAVTDATNTGLISDCVLLLAMRDTFAGTATLNWSADIPIEDWSGVHVRGLPERVEGLFLERRGLTGEIPVELSSLSNLDYLNLSSNHLTGEIPQELGNLKNLVRLYLSNNQFDGEIPEELGSLSELQHLDLSGNNFAGAIPVELGNLSILRTLRLGSNRLMSEIPVELGRLTYLTHLTLNDNDLEGSIPASLESLWRLEHLYIGNNRLTGCVPPRLRDVPDNDFDRLGLSFCALSLPDAPTVSLVTSEIGSLAISWSPPLSDGGSDITAYDLRHIETSADETVDSNWTVAEDVWTTGGGDLEYTLTGLTADIQYDIQVRAVNAEGDGPWSETVTATTTRGTDCTTGNAVPTAANNPGLVSDCEALLEAKSDLVGSGTLNWNADTPMTQWDGVRLSGTPRRLTRLLLSQEGLSGTIPALLGRLSMLIELDIRNNQLTGEIPAELGDLTSLQELYLSSNQLTGCIPEALRDVATNDFDELSLPYCDVLLDGLAISPGSLTPAFGPYRIDYVALTTTSRVTVTPANDDNATFRFLDHNQNEIPDADGSLDGHQIDLNEMVTTLSIVVTSEDGRATRTYTIAIGRVPGSPSVSEVSPGDRQLTVSWMAPSETVGADITGYDLRYIETTADETVDSNWTVVEDVWTTGGGELEYTVTGLTSDTEYDLQVRAVNAAGDGPWSVTVTGVPTTSFDCVTGGAVADAANAGLVSDCAVLIALRDTLAGSASLNWSADIPISEWDGIEEDSLEGSPPQVVRLYLGGLGLDGAVPSELSGLTELKELYLQDNDLSGPIPSELGELSGLTYLHLQNNDLTGGIPAELGDLAVLRELRLDSNDLTGQLPPELRSLTRVTRLWVADNDLSGSIPAEIGDMANLDWLNLGRNNFSGQIPAELGNLSRMRRLYIYENDLSGPIPGALGNLSRLTHIVAQGNNLSGEIPAELGDLVNLVWLGLHDNDLTGEIPAELGGLAKLQRLYLTNNELYGEVPEELGDLSALTNLWLNHNYLSGQIPQSLDNLDKLSRLRLAGNRFTGCLPAGLAAVRNSDADQLGLDTCADAATGTAYGGRSETLGAVAPRQATTGDCATGGAVPDAANNPGLVSDCEVLLAARDALIGTTGNADLNWSADTPISEWNGIEEDSLEGSPQRVTRFYLNGLGLGGTIPSGLSGLTALKELYLHDNDLAGPIPPELGDLPSLTHLHLQNNDLTGGIPAELGDLAVLRELRLDSNDLTGQLPPELGKLTRVTRLWVADNDLSGPIPAGLGGMTNLDWLNLGRNNFSGQIPAELGDLARMRRLYIYENDLSGPVPGALGSLSRLTHMVAQANDLSGQIPTELGNLSSFVWIGLHDNDLTGEIPAELGSLAKLQRLYLTNNELYGEVPEELGDLSALTNLWLNHNYLSGQIPESLDNLDKLSRLRLASNRFTGCLPAGLAAVRNSDADQLDLETCAAK